MTRTKAPLQLDHPKPRLTLPAEPPRDVNEFLQAVPAYFKVAREASYPQYDEIIYTIRRPLTHGAFERILAFAGHKNGGRDEDEQVFREVDQVLRSCVYPDVKPLAQLAKFGLDLRTASAVLHFYNPAYPFYDVASLAALRRLGQDVPFELALDENGLRAYAKFVQVVQDYKERIYWAFVPECHYYLTRVIEGALWGMGATMGAMGA